MDVVTPYYTIFIKINIKEIKQKMISKSNFLSINNTIIFYQMT